MSKKLTLTDEKINKLAEFLENGHALTHALKAMGIPTATYYQWIKKAEAIRDGKETSRIVKSEKEKLLKFLEKIDKAKFKPLDFHVKNIMKGAVRNIKISQWFLERRYPDEWGDKSKLKVEADVNISFMEKARAAWQKKQK